MNENEYSREELLGRARHAAVQIKQHAAWAESHGRLHEQAVAALVEAQVPRLYLPTRLGGLAVDPVTCALICETLADADASAAWFVMVYNAARLMGAKWPESMVEALWREDPDTLVAASGHTPLQVRPVNGGYIVSGRNSFVSGCHHARYILAPAQVEGAENTPHMVAVPAEQCRIVDNWHTLGMRGTGSNDVEVSDVMVPAELLAPAAESANTLYQDDLYQCPSRVVFATYVPVALSLARQALDFLSDLARNKVPYASPGRLAQRSLAQVHFGKGLGIYRSARQYFLATLDQYWQRSVAGEAFSAVERADLYLAGTHTLQACAEAVRHVADAAGSSVSDRGQPLERILRDMESLRHHGFANESRFGSVAQVHWDVELDYPLLLR